MSEQINVSTFADLMERGILEIGDGYRAKLEDLGGDGPFFLRAGLLSERGFDWASAERFRADVFSKVRSKLGRPGDTMVTTKGNSVGRTSYVPLGTPEFVYSPHLSYWRSVNSSQLSSRFLRYWSKSPEFSAQLYSMAHSTDMAPYLSLADQRRLRISLPSIFVQEAVAEVLSALDDKIACNESIVMTAVTLADCLFDELSVNLQFGPDTFGTVASVYGGGTPQTSEPSYWDGSIAWATPSDVTALGAPYLFKTSRMITDVGLANCASQLYPSGSIFMTSRATIGAFAVPQMPAAVNQGFIVVVPPRDDLRWWLFHEMRSRVDEMISLANGSTFLELSRGNFKVMPIRVASLDVLRWFDAKVAPLHQRAAKAVQESGVLAGLRDTLLPKLMSGEIRVREAEKVVEEVT